MSWLVHHILHLNMHAVRTLLLHETHLFKIKSMMSNWFHSNTLCARSFCVHLHMPTAIKCVFWCVFCFVFSHPSLEVVQIGVGYNEPGYKAKCELAGINVVGSWCMVTGPPQSVKMTEIINGLPQVILERFWLKMRISYLFMYNNSLMWMSSRGMILIILATLRSLNTYKIRL